MLIYFHFLFLAFIPPAICLVMIYFAGCNKQMVVALLCATVGFNGLNFSSVSCNHIDIAPRFAGTLMGFTNSVANTMGFLAPQIIGKIIDGHVSNYELISVRSFFAHFPRDIKLSKRSDANNLRMRSSGLDL